ncbi:MAG: cytochrome C oxidase subunit IV family protein [Bacteroidota bacterium]
MADHHNYEEVVKKVYVGLGVLALVTLIEVFISLLGKGHIFESAKDMRWMLWVAGFLIIVLSAYKAYYIIYKFMHMEHEVPGLQVSVLLPTALLIWGMIAFFQEGGSWNARRQQIKDKNEKKVNQSVPLEGSIYHLPDDEFKKYF